MKVYLDNCCFNRPYDNQNQLSIKLETEAKLSIQEMIKDKKLFLLWSFMLDYENSANTGKSKRDSIYEWYNYKNVGGKIMRSDYEICDDGLKLLFSKMDILEAEKFIILMKQDKFDYTQWRKNLWEDKSLEDICRQGDEFSKKLRKK